MTTIIITLLIILGIILIVAELLFIPGVTVAGFGAIVSFIASITMTYINYGFNEAIFVLIISIVISTITLVVCTRKKSLSKLSLDATINSQAAESTDSKVAIGTTVISTTRLAPMGNIMIGGDSFQAKSISGYIEAQTKVVVVAHEDSIIIVKAVEALAD